MRCKVYRYNGHFDTTLSTIQSNMIGSVIAVLGSRAGVPLETYGLMFYFNLSSQYNRAEADVPVMCIELKLMKIRRKYQWITYKIVDE